MLTEKWKNKKVCCLGDSLTQAGDVYKRQGIQNQMIPTISKMTGLKGLSLKIRLPQSHWLWTVG